MSSRYGRVILIAWRVVLAVVALFSAPLLLWNANAIPWPERTFELKKIRASEGFGFTSKMPAPWPGFTYAPQSGVLTENGRVLTPVNENEIVREKGLGAFRVGGEKVLFSTSDASDPMKTARTYSLRVRTVVIPWLRPLILMAGGLALLLLVGKHLLMLGAWMRENTTHSAALSARALALALFAVALAARLGFLWLHPDYTDEQMSIRGTPYSDARDWLGMAKSTAEGRGVDSTYPGMRALYPMFLANFYTWFGNSVPLAKGLHALIGAASTAVIFLLLRRAMPLWPAIAAALFFALDPRQVTQAGRLMTEPFGLLLIMLSAWCLIIGGERRRPALLFAAGAFFACSNLARPLTLFAFPIFIAIIGANALLRESRCWRAATLHCTAFALGTAMCLAPWVIRERSVHGIWGISCNSSSALFAASTPEFGVWASPVEDLPRIAGVPYKVKARYEYFQERFRENLKKYPGFYASNIARSLGAAARDCSNVSPSLRAAGFGALGMWCLFALLRGGARAIPSFALPAIAAAVALLFVNDQWATGFTIIGAALTVWWRPFPGTALLVTHFGGLLGSALFGNPDLQRVRLLIDWVEAGWLLAGIFVVGSAAAALLLRAPLKVMLGLQPIATRDSADEPPPPWLRWLGIGFAAFLLVSIARLIVLNAFITPAPRPRIRFTDAERAVHLQEFAKRFPAWQRIADPALIAAPRSWQRRAYVEFGAIEPEVYHFPAGVGFQHWSGRFEPRPHPHTSGILSVSGASFAGTVWIDFADKIPVSARGSICLLIGLTTTRPAVAAYLENSVEAVAIIPAPDFKPDFTRAIVAPVLPETSALLEASTTSGSESKN